MLLSGVVLGSSAMGVMGAIIVIEHGYWPQMDMDDVMYAAIVMYLVNAYDLFYSATCRERFIGISESRLRRIFEQKEQYYGAHHPECISSSDYLARMLRSQRRFEDAEQVYAKTLAACSRVYGCGHHVTMGLLYELAALYHQQSGRTGKPVYQVHRLDNAEDTCTAPTEHSAMMITYTGP